MLPIIDLFAGPGGLGEGFTEAGFDIKLSIECNETAHKTLLFRSFYRKIKDAYIAEVEDYLLGKIDIQELYCNHPKAFEEASKEAWQATLGETPDKEVSDRIHSALGKTKKWVLIGGPPCQAYSLAARSRAKNEGEKFENDSRHFLYKQYLRIVAEHAPDVFVMENVRGILSANVKKKKIFSQIISDLKSPRKATKVKPRRHEGELDYEIFPLVAPAQHNFDGSFAPEDYLVRAEEHGVPQRRHRVFIIGIRKGTRASMKHLEKSHDERTTVENVIKKLPPLRSDHTKQIDTDWVDSLKSINKETWFKALRKSDPVLQSVMETQLESLLPASDNGAMILKKRVKSVVPEKLRAWYIRQDLPFILNHECRNHMAEDLKRYFYAACYSIAHKVSPTLSKYPESLLPKHENINSADGKIIFDDRFRVQCWHKPSTTVVSHISKDGHYYIHPDPKQCRSLSVREAARLQTFPDDYFFQGPRTAQFHQVGNAVPPYLAWQIACKVSEMLGEKPQGKY
jgi:DNA (cytosine-5)-methyltransferase 1